MAIEQNEFTEPCRSSDSTMIAQEIQQRRRRHAARQPAGNLADEFVLTPKGIVGRSSTLAPRVVGLLAGTMADAPRPDNCRCHRACADCAAPVAPNGSTATSHVLRADEGVGLFRERPFVHVLAPTWQRLRPERLHPRDPCWLVQQGSWSEPGPRKTQACNRAGCGYWIVTA